MTEAERLTVAVAETNRVVELLERLAERDPTSRYLGVAQVVRASSPDNWTVARALPWDGEPMSTVEAPLLPCPFCGGEAVVNREATHIENDYVYVVRCRVRECQAQTVGWYPESTAIVAWNRRVAQQKKETSVGMG